MVQSIRIIFIFASIFLLIGIATSTLTLGNYSIDKTYPQGGAIKGSINISVNNEPANNLFTTNQGNSISLYDFLNKTLGENNFNCVPQNCDKAYSASSPSASKNFQLNSANNRKKIVGFVLTGKLDNVNSGKFTFTSNAPASCTNQLEIDILDDGIIDITNNNSGSGGGVCPSTKTYGCFNPNNQAEKLGLNIACQKMNLSVSPGFVVGAQIKREMGSQTLKMEIFDSKQTSKGTCVLPPLALGEDKEIFCEINYTVTKKGEYYVCAKLDGISDPNNRYKITGYTNETHGCGIASLPSPNYDEDLAFKISAVGKQFGNIIPTNIIDSLPNDERFSNLAYNYIKDQYGYALDCNLNQCIIPISIKGNIDQDVSFSNAEVIYTKSGATAFANDFYDAIDSSVKINSDYKKINFEPLNFTVPTQYGISNFTLSYNGATLFTEEIIVAQIPVIENLIPTQAPAAVDIYFTINASSPNNMKLIRYIWDMGNGDKRETVNNTITYKYNSTGNFNLKVTVIDDKNFNASKSYNIIIGSPDKVANTTLIKKLDNLKSLKVKLAEYNGFTKNKIENELNLSNLEYELETIKRNYASASSDEDYIKIVEKLNGLDLPDNIYSRESQIQSSFIVNKENINVDVLNIIGDDKDEEIDDSLYIESIDTWYFENIQMAMSYDKVAAIYGDEEKEIVNVFDYNVDVSEDNVDEVYFIMKNLRDLSFEPSYTTKNADGYTYIKLNEKSQHIIFSTTEDVNVVDIPVFVSTLLGNLEVLVPSEPICVENDICEKDKGETRKNCRDCKPWKEYGLTIIGLLLLYIILHIILQEWYKRHYENYLFKNKNFLFNIMNYIHTEKVKGITNDEIEKNLKKSGWNGEQVRYAMRKYFGKRTGMWEIPMDWFFNIFRRNKMPKYNPRTMPPQIGIRRY